MQPIQRTLCSDRQPSSAAYLAAMIDRRARDHVRSAGRSGEISKGLGTCMQRPDAGVLIWVEGDAELVREPAAGRHRGMIVVAHGSGQGTTEGSFIISYPFETGDDGQYVDAVSGVLEAMGWSVLASRRGRTAGGHVNTAMLVSNAHPGSEQRLWLAEPVGAAQDPSAPAHAFASRSSAASADGGVRTLEIRDQLEAWVNEGGAGDDVLS